MRLCSRPRWEAHGGWPLRCWLRCLLGCDWQERISRGMRKSSEHCLEYRCSLTCCYVPETLIENIRCRGRAERMQGSRERTWLEAGCGDYRILRSSLRNEPRESEPFRLGLMPHVWRGLAARLKAVPSHKLVMKLLPTTGLYG